MKPALLLGHAIARHLAQLAVAEARVALLTANLADQLPGTPEWNTALAKLGAAQATLAELRGNHATDALFNAS